MNRVHAGSALGSQGGGPQRAITLLACMVMLSACVAAPAQLPTPTATPMPTATPLPPTATPLPPTATAEPTATASPTAATTLEMSGTAVPPRPGTFDVYLGPPDGEGRQLMRFFEPNGPIVAAEAVIQAEAGQVMRGGPYIYYLQAGSLRPMRVNSAGAIEVVAFTNPPDDASYFQIMPSPDGSLLAWVGVGPRGGDYEVGVAAADGSTVKVAARGELAPGVSIELVRLTNGGSALYFALRPPDITEETPFNERYELYRLDLNSGQSSLLPGEPACGEFHVCDGYVSLDGAYLVRTLLPQMAAEPVVVTNLTSGAVIDRFAPQEVTPSAGFAVGYPIFTPGGELVYEVAAGLRAAPEYQLVWANLVTGEQRLIAELGSTRHRPLGWTGDGFVLLTTREPDVYDTWQIDLRDGSMRKIAAMMYLGRVEVPEV